MPDTAPDQSPDADRRLALAREWDRLVAEVRELDGFRDFLRPPRADSLLPAAAGGPVAMVNVSRWRCDALLVSTGGVEATPLAGLSLDTVVARTNGYLTALRAVDEATRDLYLARQGIGAGPPDFAATRRYTDAKRAWQQANTERERLLASLLRWLWDEIADPVLAALGFDGPLSADQCPRLWWCPTGPLTLLPLHAAGYHDEAAGRTVLDRVVSSYTPTLRALVEARRPASHRPEHDRMLVVSLPDTPGQVPLLDAVRERNLLTTLFPADHTLLEGAQASAGAVQEQLPRHRWAHFSCHGNQNLADPGQGGLLLRDRRLTINDLSARQHNGEFVFLSACMTALGGVDLPDEAITLAAAMHYTGYRQVIGTLWTVYDETAADVADMVYRELTASGVFEPANAATALHRAVRHLRDTRRLPASAWSPFSHTGP